MQQQAGEALETAQSEAASVAREVVEQILEHMRVRAHVGELVEDGERIELSIRGADASLLVGEKGQTLDALQYLVNRIAGRRVVERRPISLDADGYRERRAASLVELAKRLSEKALSEGKVIALNPMSARDRRIVHLTLRDIAGISTRSEGEGDERRLLIVPGDPV